MMDVSSDRISRDCEELAEKIRNSGKEYDAFLAVFTGGAAVALLLVNSLDTRRIFSITVTHHCQGGGTGGAVLIFPPLVPPGVKKILLVDDLIDSGETVALIKRNYGKKFEFDLAVLYDKGGGDWRPDFYVAKVPQADWITFPWEKPRN